MLTIWQRPSASCLSKRSLLKILTSVIVLIILRIHLSYLLIPRKLDNDCSINHKKKQPFVYLEGSNYAFPIVEELHLRKGENKFPDEEARCVGLPKTQITRSRQSHSTKLIYLATKYFGEFNPDHYYFPHPGSKTFERYACPNSHCNVTNDPNRLVEADALLFHVRDIEVYNIPVYRHPNQLYIFYSMEPPWLQSLNLRKFEGFFNWTMSYREDSDVIVKYGFIGRKPENTDMPTRIPSKERFFRKENMALWYVSNCCTDGNREEYVAELMQYYPVQVLGDCGKEDCRPAEAKKCYEEAAQKYKFYLAFENALCPDYVTEKLFNALEYNIIPVVFGGVDYDAVAPPNSVINVNNFDKPKALAEYLWLISNNYTLYLSFFEWKKYYRSYLHPWMCDLCQKLHDFDGEMSLKTNLVEWWDKNGSCQKWTENGFEPTKNHAFPCYHTRPSHHALTVIRKIYY